MFIGDLQHTIDEKSRLTLPARFRDALGDGVVLARGLDGNVAVYPRETWTVVQARISALDPLSREARELRRFFFSGAAESKVDRQGRILVPAVLTRHAGLERDVVVAGNYDHLELWNRAAWAEHLHADRRERRTCCRTSCRATRADHVPVLADEVRELLAVQPGRDRRRRDVRRRRPRARCSPQDLAGQRQARRDRPRPGGQAVLRPLQGARRGRRALPARRLRDRPHAARANDVKADAILLDLGVSSMQIDRPERGFSYATDAPLDMRMDPSSEPTAAAIVNTWDERELATIFRRYGEERYAAPIARAIVRRRAERPFTRTGELVDVDQARDPDAGALRRGASGEARLPGAAHRRQRRARPARGRAARGARDAAARRPARRDLLPLARGPDREAVPRRRGRRAARARPTSRSACAGRSPSCGC